MSESYTIFDNALVARRQKRAAAATGDEFYLYEEGARQLSERLSDFNRGFDTVLALGRGLKKDFFETKPKTLKTATLGEGERLEGAAGEFDLFISNLALHWVNDLPGVLAQGCRALKPDGLFLAVMLGGETLTELRQALLQAETEVTSGASPRVSPFADIRDAGNLLQRAGLQMPVADIEKFVVSYETPFHLMKDLRAMGEANALLERKKTFTGRKVFERMAEIYMEKFADQEGRIPATFEFLHLKGFAPGPNQPKPLKPGSGKVDLGDVFKGKKS